MRRRHAVVLTGLVVLLGIGVALGGAAASQAGPRLIDPFTVTANPTPAQLGRHVAFTAFFKNASGHTLNQATLTSTASDGATFDSYTSSRGTCAVDPTDSATVKCTYGHLEAGAEVTTAFRFNTPPPGGATSMQLATTLSVDERGGDPGSQSIFHPSPNPTVVALEAQSNDKVDDVFDTTGGSNATAPVTLTNLTSTRLTTPATGAFEPIVISEGAVQAGTCGPGKTALLATSTISAPGTFSTTPLTVVVDLNASKVTGQLSDVVGCHNGVNLPLGVATSQGTLIGRDKVKNELGVNVIRLTMTAPTNGVWGGGNS